MTFGGFGSFKGGIDLPDEHSAAADMPVKPCPPLARLHVPLGPAGRDTPGLQVEPGARVEPGQRIAASPAGGSDVFAPLGGTVAGLTEVTVMNRHGPAAWAAIELIELSAPHEPFEAAAAEFDYRRGDVDQMLTRIAQAGTRVHHRLGEPLARWIERARRAGCSSLIANAMDNEPMIAAEHRVLCQRGAEVIEGLLIIAELVGVAEIVVAADRRRAEQYLSAMPAARANGVDLVALSHKYPTGADPILVEILTRREVPPGGTTMDVGVAVTDASTCLAARQALATGRSYMHRVVTIAGRHADQQGNFWLPVGAVISDLVAQAQTVICGGPMTGVNCPADAVVTPSTNAILAIDAPAAEPATPCIRCSWCTDYCPARLNVAALNDAFELGLLDQAEQLAAPACVECGICTYVCPARLPLSQRMRQLKRTVATKRRNMPLFANP